MKKLMTMIGALAMSFGLFAATPFTTSFDSGDDGVNGTEYTSKTANWDGLSDPLTLGVYGDGEAYDYSTTNRREAFENANLQYLPLDTEASETLTHEIGEGNIFVDQLVRFTGFEEPQTNLAEGTKIAVWMSEFEEETTTTTNLYVTVGSDNVNLDKQIAVKLEGEYEIGKWYRLTVKSLGDIFNAGEAAPRAGFAIWVDGVKKGIDSEDTYYTGLISHTEQLKSAAADAYAKHQLFPAISSGEGNVALTAVGYKGIGAIDDIYFDDQGPDFTVENYTFTIADDARVEVASVYAGGKKLEKPYTVAPGTEVTITYTAKEGYKLRDGADTQTTKIESAGQVVAVDATQVEILDVVATVTNTGDVEKFAEDELSDMMAGLEDGDYVEFFADVEIKDGDDVQYAFSDGTTIDVADVGGVTTWEIVSETAGDLLTDNCGVAEGFCKIYELVDEDSAVIFAGEVAGTLQADYVSNGDDAITLIGEGKVITMTEDLAVEPADEVEVLPDTPEEGWYTYQIETEPPVVYVAQIGGVKYETLAAAVAAVGENETIELLADCASVGISVPSGKAFTIDFAGKKVTFNKPGAGSPNTKTQAFQLLQGSTIVFKNGTICCSAENKDMTWVKTDAEKGIAMIIQNYANLTLEGMTIDGANIAKNGSTAARYLISNNSGNVVFEDTIITANEGDIAFDTCKYNTYTLPTVEVKGDSEINGDVELSGGNLTLTAGELDGELIDAGIGGGVITKADGFEADAPAGYIWKDGVLTKIAEPTATVITITDANHEAAVKFTAGAIGAGYDNWNAKFILTSSVAIGEGEIQLGGQYDAFSAEWLDKDFAGCAAGAEVDVLEAVGITDPITVDTVFNVVKAFNCGVKNVALKNDATFTLKLVITDGVTTKTLCTIDNLEVKAKAKPIEPLDPEQPKHYDDPAEAAEAVAEMNNAAGTVKPEYIKIPAAAGSTDTEKAAYAGLFKAVADGAGNVTIEFTADAEEAIEEEITDAQATVIKPDADGKATIETKPGLFYGIAAVNEVGAIKTADPTAWEQATSTSLKLEVPTVEGTKAFFQIHCQAKDPKSNQ